MEEDEHPQGQRQPPTKHKRKRNPSPLPAPTNYHIPKKSDTDGAKQRGCSNTRSTYHSTTLSRDTSCQGHRSSTSGRPMEEDFGQSCPPSYKTTPTGRAPPRGVGTHTRGPHLRGCPALMVTNRTKMPSSNKSGTSKEGWTSPFPSHVKCTPGP